MRIDFTQPPKIRREPYLEYEFVSDFAGGSKILFNDPALSYNHLVALEIGDKLLRFQLVGAQPTTTIPGEDYLVYPSVLPGVDLAYDLYDGKAKETLVINSAQAQREFSFLLETNGVTATLQPDNSIIYKDAESNTVWTIEAPYATDANGKDVITYLNFDGTSYTVGITPDETTAYPVKLDPTVSFSIMNYVWKSEGVINADTYPAYRMIVGRGDGMSLFSSVTVYCVRKVYNTPYTYNTGLDSNAPHVHYQFFDKDNTAISEILGVVVADTTNWLGTISIPANAYSIEFTGSVPNKADGSTNILQIKTAEAVGSTSNWSVTRKPLPLYSSVYAEFSIPDAQFNSATNGSAVSQTIDAPPGTFFTAGAYTFTSKRSSSNYIKNCYIDLYFADGTLQSSTSIPYPSTAPASGFNQASKSITVPEGIARIILRGTKSAATTTFQWPTVSGKILTTAPEYGTVQYALTLAGDVADIPISPGFGPMSPANPYKTYVCYGADVPGNYVESATVTALAGTTVNIKACLTADETTRSTFCDNICLASSPYTSVSFTADSRRCIAQVINLNGDALRTITAAANASGDTARETLSSQTAYADSTRSTLAAVNALSDTKRQVTVLHAASALMDVLRNVIKSSELSADTKRRAAKNDSVSPDTKRNISMSISNAADTRRKTSATASSSADAKRSLVKSILAEADTQRGLNISVLTNADTQRRIGVAQSGACLLDTVRAVIKSITTENDLVRRVLSASSATADTKRRTGNEDALVGDSVRRISATAQTNADAGRKINALTINRFDSARKLKGFIYTAYDTQRRFGSPVIAYFDTKRRTADGVWPFIKRHDLNIQIQSQRITILSFED